MAMLAWVTGGTPVGSHRLCPTVVRVRRDRAQVAAVAAAPSAWSEWAQFALEQGAEQMVYVGMNVLEEEAAAGSWQLAGAGNGAEHQLIRQSACRLVALATLSTLDQKARRTMHEKEGDTKGIFIAFAHARMPESDQTASTCLESAMSRPFGRAHEGGGGAEGREHAAWLARARFSSRRSTCLWCRRTPYPWADRASAGRERPGQTGPWAWVRSRWAAAKLPAVRPETGPFWAGSGS